MIDITSYGVRFRGYPVSYITERCYDVLGQHFGTFGPDQLLQVLDKARDVAESGEPADWYFVAELDDETARTMVMVVRGGGVRDFTKGRHEGGSWTLHLPSEH